MRNFKITSSATEGVDHSPPRAHVSKDPGSTYGQRKAGPRIAAQVKSCQILVG